MGTLRKICHQEKNSEGTGYSCQSPWSAPPPLSWKILLTSGKAQKERSSENQNCFSSPAPPPRPPSPQLPHAFGQHLQQHLHPSLLVRGRGRGPSSPTLWTIFLISSHLKLNQDWMMTVQRRGRESSSCIGSQQPPPPQPHPSAQPSASGAYSAPQHRPPHVRMVF